MNVIAIIVFVILMIKSNGISGQQSPCPGIFEYKYDQNQPYGAIRIPNPGYGTTKVSVNISIFGRIQKGNGEGLKLMKSLDDTVEDLKKGFDIQYRLNFPLSNQPPLIIFIKVNDRDICSAPKDEALASWVFSHSFTYPAGDGFFNLPPIPTTTRRPPFVITTPTTTTTTAKSTMKPTPWWLNRGPSVGPIPTPSVNSVTVTNTDWLDSTQCGRTDLVSPAGDITPLVIGGWQVEPNQYPWLTAIFKFNKRSGLQFRPFICGGSLISNKHVLTAAHCTKEQTRIYLELGRHDINNIDEQGVLVRLSERIIEHPDYRNQTAHADIALIVIEQVTFTNKIIPICIWSFGAGLSDIEGTIAGWGRIENGGDVSPLPRQLKVNVVSQNECQKVEKLSTITSVQTFCAGGKSAGPCQGDSGGGFYVQRNNRWYLRGIISTSLGTAFTCDVDYYAVYADVAQYINWLKMYLN